MSSVPTLERVRRKLESILNEDVADAFKYTDISPLTQFRAVVNARRQLSEVEYMLSQVEEGLKTSAQSEWENITEQYRV